MKKIGKPKVKMSKRQRVGQFLLLVLVAVCLAVLGAQNRSYRSRLGVQPEDLTKIEAFFATDEVVRATERAIYRPTGVAARVLLWEISVTQTARARRRRG